MKQLILCLIVCSGAVATAADVPWLNEITQPPPGVSEKFPAPRPPLRDASGSPFSTREQWEQHRPKILQAWKETLGPLPAPAPQLEIEILKEESLARCTRTLIRYSAEPTRRVRAYLFRPHDAPAGKLPAVVVFHGTSADTIDTVGGLVEPDTKHHGLRLAERGYIVICPENYLWEQSSYLKAAAAARERHPHSLGMATMLADGLRAVDVLYSLPEVDVARIGAFGHSLGAKETLYQLAFDERVRGGVSSEGGVGIPLSNWEAEWYLGANAKKPSFGRDHHELLALIAPRPLLILAGETGRGCVDGERSWPYVLEGQHIARLYGEPVRMGILNHGEGHAVSLPVAERAYQFLDAVLEHAPR